LNCRRQTGLGTRALSLSGLIAALLLVACGSGGSASSAAPTAILGSRAMRPLGHVAVIVLENKEYQSVAGNLRAAPYLNALASVGAMQRPYFAVAHPSLPNYLALVSGSTHGISADCDDCFVDAPNLADQIERSGRTWRAYMEGMPSPCFMGDAGLYAQRHNPWVYFDNVRTNSERCRSHVVPFAQLDVDLRAEVLPDFVWITPDVCNDMHDCPVATGDAWLGALVPRLLASPAFVRDGAIFIVFDEGNSDAGCCDAEGGGQVFMVVVGSAIRPRVVSTVPATHYTLLRTIEDGWGLAPLGEAVRAASFSGDIFVPPMPTAAP